MFATTQQHKLINQTGRGFTVKLTLDHFSRRLWVHHYTCRNPAALLGFVTATAARHGLEKIIFPVRKEDLGRLKTPAFQLEGWIDGFFNGADGCFLTAYPVRERGHSPVLRRWLRQVGEIQRRPRKNPPPLPAGHEIFIPGPGDTTALADLFRQAFSTYPSPVDQPAYLAGVLGQTALFRAARHNGQMVSAAAAEIDPVTGSAELTNCATLPHSRGGGMMSRLLAALEQDCLARDIRCLYSLARASSYGMNLVFHRLGFRYRGTLVNNCHIDGEYENMNIWAKYAP